jgi:hypothetical protein
VEAPVLVVYGTGDMVMSRADSDAIGQIVNGVHPGAATDLTVEGMTHLFEKDGKFYAPLVPAVLDWMKRQK